MRALVIFTLTAAAVSLGFAFTRASNTPLASSNVYCGVERAAVKHLTDHFVLPTHVTARTPAQLILLTPPHVTRTSRRLPQERQLVQLTNVHITAVKQETDSDLHIIIASPQGEMNVEAPMGICEHASPYAHLLTVARAAADQALPNASSSSYTPVDLHATIRGVLFFDVLHGQRGAANGAELHPLTYFKVVP